MKGDIDLTQNLDFYRKKPKKLLPVNVKLSRPVETKKSNTVNELNTVSIEDSNLYITSTYSNTSSLSTNNVRIRTRFFDDISYGLEVYNSDFTSTYNDVTVNYNISYSHSNQTINIVSANSYDSWYSIDYNNIAIPEKQKPKFKLWKHREEEETRDSVVICKCKNCGKKYMITRKSKNENNRCRECLRLYNAERSMEHSNIGRKLSNVFGSLLNKTVTFTRYDERRYPWSSRDNITKLKEERSDRPIPWLRPLNSRMYSDYMDELRGVDNNFDSYLTNMSWLGIRENVEDVSEDFIASGRYVDLIV